MVFLPRVSVFCLEVTCAMIVEYEIDFQYFIDLMRSATPLDMRCQCALRLLEIARYENGRFVIRRNDSNVEKLRTSLTSGNCNNGRVSLFDIKRDYVVSEYYLGLFLPYGVISEKPSIRILDGDDVCPTYHIGDGEGQVGLVQYFQTADVQRRSYLGKQTFLSRQKKNAEAICFEGFDTQLEIFAAAEKTGYIIVDPYCLGGRIEDVLNFIGMKVKILLNWVYHLARHGAMPLRFDVYTSCPYFELPRSRDYCGGMGAILEEDENDESLLLRELRSKWENCRFREKRRNDQWPIMIRFHIILDANWLIHDRFVGSSTHYFSMGRGLDGVVASKDGIVAYNVYYCGKRGIREEPDVKRILDYVESHEGTEAVTLVECALDGYTEG